MNNKNEIWKDIPNYEGLYAASSLGRIMSYAKKVWTGFGYRIAPDRILSPSKMKTGYLCVALNKNKKSKTYTVHKLIALTFIPNPNNKEQIDHIDGHKTNNRIENLRWATRIENMNNPKTRIKGRCKPVICIETKIIYKSMKNASKITKTCESSIRKVCEGINKTAGGYHWKYVDKEAC